jgi:hypothetical protein
MKNKTNSSKAAGLAVLGASLAGIAATAYFFFGPKGKSNQRHAKAWAIKMKGDVVGELEKAREITEPVYHEIINSVAKEYAKNKGVGRNEVNLLAKDLRKHWKTISKSALAAKRSVKKDVVRVAKKASKKPRR